MTLAIIMSVVLVLATTAIHLLFFATVARHLTPRSRVFDLRSYCLMIGLFALHLMDIALYAAAFFVGSDVLDLGTLEGPRAAGGLGHFYASAVIYTTLGFGDVLPNEHLRCLAATEALNGLLFIAWSASYMFAVMGRAWTTRTCEPLAVSTKSH